MANFLYRSMELWKVFAILNAFIYSGCFAKPNIDIESDPKQNCTCVPYYQCSYDSGDLITDGKGLLDLR